MIDEFYDDEAEDAGEQSDLRRLVTFELAGELYGVPIVDVAEIREQLPATPLPNVAPHVLGLINVRGTIMPVVDPRRVFGLESAAEGPDTRLIILKGPSYQIALRVDAVRGLSRIAPSEFRAAPAGVSQVGAEYYDQVALVGDRLLVELNVEKMMDSTRSGSDGLYGER
jgi:purine-binding chemotaxis protein CheW